MSDILLKAKVTKAARRKNGTVSLTATTVGEVTPDDLFKIDSVLDTPGYLSFSPNPGDQSKVPSAPVEDLFETPSQRLRAVIYVMYDQSTKKATMDFEEYYRGVMEVLISNVKARLRA